MKKIIEKLKRLCKVILVGLFLGVLFIIYLFDVLMLFFEYKYFYGTLILISPFMFLLWYKLKDKIAIYFAK